VNGNLFLPSCLKAAFSAAQFPNVAAQVLFVPEP
jgi:hypothetical protein